MQLEQAFPFGSLQLPDTPPGQETLLAQGPGIPEMALVTLAVVLAILLLPRFLNLLPLLADSVFRARGSSSLENSVRASHDRSVMAFYCALPALLVLFRYRLYDAAFLRDLPSSWRLLALAGVLTGLILLRLLLYWLLKPRRRFDFYVRAHRAGYTCFILFVLLVLATVGILALFRCPDNTIRLVLYVETAAVYLFFLVRSAQILSLSCNPLRTFLYLCGLEILPSALLVVSAILL